MIDYQEEAEKINRRINVLCNAYEKATESRATQKIKSKINDSLSELAGLQDAAAEDAADISLNMKLIAKGLYP